MVDKDLSPTVSTYVYIYSNILNGRCQALRKLSKHAWFIIPQSEYAFLYTSKIPHYLTPTHSQQKPNPRSGAQVFGNTRLNRLELLAELIPNPILQPFALSTLHQLRSLDDITGTHELAVRLLAYRNTSMDQVAGADFSRTCNHLLNHPTDSPDDEVVVTHQFRFAKARGKCVDCNVELGHRMVASDVADCEDLEEFANVVAVTHAGGLAVVQSVEDVLRLALGELDDVSRCCELQMIIEGLYSRWSCSGRRSSQC
jgi:hypothetical protein